MVKSIENDPKTLKNFRLRRGMIGWDFSECILKQSSTIIHDSDVNNSVENIFRIICKYFLSLKRTKMVLERAAGAEKLGFGGSKIRYFGVFPPPPFLGRCLRRRGGKNSRNWVDHVEVIWSVYKKVRAEKLHLKFVNH